MVFLNPQPLRASGRLMTRNHWRESGNGSFPRFAPRTAVRITNWRRHETLKIYLARNCKQQRWQSAVVFLVY